MPCWGWVVLYFVIGLISSIIYSIWQEYNYPMGGMPNWCNETRKMVVVACWFAWPIVVIGVISLALLVWILDVITKDIPMWYFKLLQSYPPPPKEKDET